jgi:CPA1 family monovalent cation:H+ antiporter
MPDHPNSLSPFDAAAILILIASILGYINHRYFRLPSSVGLTVMGAVASLVVVAIGALIPSTGLAGYVEQFLSGIDFHQTLMEGMLSFLLFAGALHVDWHDMRKGRWAIMLLATVGVTLSTILVGLGFWFVSDLFSLSIPLIWCLVFGALISPTDPVAVMGIMKRATVPPELQAMVAGESLFNDGIGVVVFTILLTAALGTEPFTFQAASMAFLREAVGGALLGGAIGYVAYRAMRSIDEYNVEVMISLAVVMAGYSMAHWLHLSGPVAMAVAGLLIGNAGVAHAMSDLTEDYLIKFWALIDEILNAVLFMLIGLEVIVVVGEPRLLAIGLLAIPLVLVARTISVLGPLGLVRKTVTLERLTVPTLVWGGLRGGISIALALSLPDGPMRNPILATTFAVVLFSVIVQGGTIGGLIARLTAKVGKA